MPHKTLPDSRHRQLKIYSKYQERRYHQHTLCPEIRLCGQWLEQLGFRRGDWVTVQPSPGRLLITLNRCAPGGWPAEPGGEQGSLPPG